MDLSIKHLRDNKSGESAALFYPVTHESAVVDDNGVTLETKIGEIQGQLVGLNGSAKPIGSSVNVDWPWISNN